MTWSKGQTGNPGGRKPKTLAAKKAEMILEDGSPKAARALLRLIDRILAKFDAADAGELQMTASEEQGYMRELRSAGDVVLTKARVGTPEKFPANLEDWTLSHFYEARRIADAAIAEAEAKESVH